MDTDSNVDELSGVSCVSSVAAFSGAVISASPTICDGVLSVSDPAKKFMAYRVVESDIQIEGRWLHPGLYFHDPEADTGLWVCSALYVEAITCDEKEDNFGRLLRFKNSLGNWCSLAMPMEMLRGSCEELRGILLSMGLELGTEPKARQHLSRYLQEQKPDQRLRCALRTGWHGDSFVLPNRVIGPTSEEFIFQSKDRLGSEYSYASTLEAWQSEISSPAVGNPMLIMALSAAFSGPLLHKCRMEGGGLHFVGDSSTGKTTLLEAACSVWGGPEYRRSWRSTANGMEGAAVLFNDCLLALDEISECLPSDVGAIIYALANGVGKQRAGRTGSARAVARWCCASVSTGERSIETVLQEGGNRPLAGQAVRMLDIPVSRTFGAWDELHGIETGMLFSDAIKRSSATHYGCAGIAFLEKLTFDTRNHIHLLDRIKSLPEFDTARKGGEGQSSRAAARFALLGYAGELATEYGITGWPEGAAIQASSEGFRLWLSSRGQGNDERNKILLALSDYIERHGDGRFSKMNANTPINNRAGWWRQDGDHRCYMFTSDGIHEALKGFDFARALDVLLAMKVLLGPNADGKSSKSTRIDGRQARVYEISQAALQSCV